LKAFFATQTQYALCKNISAQACGIAETVGISFSASGDLGALTIAIPKSRHRCRKHSDIFGGHDRRFFGQ